MSSTHELIQKYISLYVLQESEENPSAVVLTFTNKDRIILIHKLETLYSAGSAVVDGEPMVGLGNNDNTELDNGQQFVIKNPQIIGSFKGMIKGHAGRVEIIEAHFVMYEREVTTDDGKVVLQQRVGFLFLKQKQQVLLLKVLIIYLKIVLKNFKTG